MLDVSVHDQYAVLEASHLRGAHSGDRWRPPIPSSLSAILFADRRAAGWREAAHPARAGIHGACGASRSQIYFSPPYYMADVLDQMDIIGVGSLPIVLLTGFFIGAVMVLQTAAQFERFGQTALTADVVSLALVRELGPSITGLLVAGRNSSGMASELGSMLVTEQVDAMRAMGTDPIRKLVTPRMIATVLMLPLLTAMADFMGLIGGYLVVSLSRCGWARSHSGRARSMFWSFPT